MTDAHAPAENPPAPVSRAIIFAFVVILFLSLTTQMLALYNSGLFSDTVSTFIESEVEIQRLTLAVTEIEKAAALDGDTGATSAAAYRLHIHIAEDILAKPLSVASRFAPLQSTVAQALTEQKSRRAPAAGNRNAALLAAKDELRTFLLAEKFHIETMQAQALRQARMMEISLSIIVCSMVLIGFLLAWLWKRLVALH